MHAPPPDPATADLVPGRIRLGWGVGSYGLAVLFNAYSTLLLFYLTNVVGLKLALAGTLLLVIKVYNLVMDVPMGILSDRTRTRIGRRRPYLFAAAFVSGACFVMLFNVPVPPEGTAPGTGTTLWVLGALLLYATGYTMFNVPYMAMPGEMSRSYHERTAIMSYRVIFIQLGNFTAVGLAPRLAERFGGGAAGYGVVGWTLGLAAMVAMLACFFGTAGARSTEQASAHPGLLAQLRSTVGNRPFMLLAAFKLLTLFSAANVMAMLLFLVKNVLRLDQGVMLWYSLAYLGATLVTVPLLWVPLAKCIGKQRTLILATAGFAVVALSWLLAGPGETEALFVLRAFLLGSLAAGKLLLGQTMLPDVMEYDFLKTGLRREGVYAGAYSLVEKTAFALSPLVVALILGLLGYHESVDNRFVEQSADAIRGIYLNIAVIPALCNVAAIVALLKYDLTEEKLKGMRAGA